MCILIYVNYSVISWLASYSYGQLLILCNYSVIIASHRASQLQLSYICNCSVITKLASPPSDSQLWLEINQCMHTILQFISSMCGLKFNLNAPIFLNIPGDMPPHTLTLACLTCWLCFAQFNLFPNAFHTFKIVMLCRRICLTNLKLLPVPLCSTLIQFFHREWNRSNNLI